MKLQVLHCEVIQRLLQTNGKLIEIPRERYMFSKKRQQNMDELRLI